MNTRPIASACLAVALCSVSRGFLGFADTSFVTVIANPAEAANWAAELQRLNDQLAAATGTLRTVGELRAFAGDPKAAVGAVPGLEGISDQFALLAAGAKTDAQLLQAWQAMDASARRKGAADLLKESGAGVTMQVFGSERARDPSLYEALARGASSAAQLQGQIESEQAARYALASELTLAWGRFKRSTTESEKQAFLAEISQLQSQNQVMDTRRRAILDDLELSDRQDRASSGTREKSKDEQLLAESALLNDSAAVRARGAEDQRLATLRKPVPHGAVADYSALRLWSTADTGGASN